MARETLASLQAIIDAQKEELTELRKLLPLSADDVRDIVRDMMHTVEAEDYIAEIARSVAEDAASDAVDNLDLEYQIRDVMYELDPESIGAAPEDHSHEVR